MNGNSATILSGRVIRAEKTAHLIEKVKTFLYTPTLAIIQVGDRPDSAAYIKAKKTFAAQIGVRVEHAHFAENVSFEEIRNKVAEFNADTTVQGIIVQLPLPAHLDSDSIIATIDPSKDVDGLTQINRELLKNNNSTAIIPATARGVKELLEYYHIDLKGKKVAVVGRSKLVGTPVAHIAQHAGADVIVCHSKTEDLAHEIRKADIVIVAVGKPGLIGKYHLKEGAVVVDIGINRLSDGTLAGDVDFAAVKDVVSAITPVPGGVGQMTVLALFENLVDACK